MQNCLVQKHGNMELEFGKLEFGKLEFGKPIKRKGYTSIPLYDSSLENAHKNAFLEAMDNKGLPKALIEWIYNEYIKEKYPVTFQTPSTFQTSFQTPSINTHFGNIETNGKKQYSLQLKLDSNESNLKEFERYFEKLQQAVSNFK